MKQYLDKLLAHSTLTRAEAAAVLCGINDGRFPAEQIAAFVSLLRLRGITADELLGLRDGVLATGRPVRLDVPRCIDIVGTGGDGKNTFNISTAACFVAAAAGCRVAKHGNFAATSVSGASTVLQYLGAKFTAGADALNRTMARCGMVYLHAPLFATAMKNVAPVRRALPFATCFNILGPLVNPARPACSLFGTATLDQQRLYVGVCRKLDIDHAVVNTVDGYDEISLTADFKVCTRAYDRVFSPADLGLPVCPPDALCAGGTIAEAAKTFTDVLAGHGTAAAENAVVANAAFAIQTYRADGTPIDECLAAAREAIKSGRAAQKLKDFLESEK